MSQSSALLATVQSACSLVFYIFNNVYVTLFALGDSEAGDPHFMPSKRPMSPQIMPLGHFFHRSIPKVCLNRPLPRKGCYDHSSLS